MNQRTFQYLVVDLLALLLIFHSIALLMFKEYLNVMFGNPLRIGYLPLVFGWLGWVVIIIASLVLVVSGYFSLQRFLAYW